MIEDPDGSFMRWRELRVTSDPSVLGGEPVFSGTRLSVRRIGEAAEQGEAVATLLEDYPYLTIEDVEFARWFARDLPPRGGSA